MKPNLTHKHCNEPFLNKWTLSFLRKEYEVNYRKEYFLKSIYSFRIAFVLLTILYAIFGIFDVKTSSDFLQQFLLIRYAIVVPLFITVLLLSFTKSFKGYWQLITAVCFVVSGSGIAYMLLANPTNLWYYGGMFLIFMAGYFFIKLQLLWATLAGTSVILFYNLAPSLFTSLDFNSNYHTISNAFFISSNIIAIAATYNSQKIERNEFCQRMLLLAQQNEIQQINQTLEGKVQRRTQLLEKNNRDLEIEIDNRKKTEKDLTIALNKAEESERLKSAFLTNLSHEIRTPMNGIIGFLDMITDPDMSNEERKQFFDIVKQSGKRLLTTINDIVDLSRIEAGEITVNNSEVELSKLFSYLKESFSLELKFKNIPLSVPNNFPCEKIETDSSKLEAILQHLVNNALKFTATGKIEAGLEVDNSYLKFWVSDTGKGVPKERQEAIFESFVQADTGFSRGYEGTGLGLSICKAYAECLGGRIWLESEPNKGSTFFFTIHYKPIELNNNKMRTPMKKDPHSAAPNKQVLVLVAEDDDISYNLLETLLRNEVDKLIRARNGKEAVNLFQQRAHEVSMVFMDIKMPVMDGIEATKRIREQNQEVPIIAQTAFALSGDREVALEAGCNDYLSKPLKLHDVIAMVKKYR